MDSFRRDLRFALRSLARRRLLATMAIVTLALGIGGATSIFTVIDAVLIRDLPYRDPTSLVSVWRAWPSWRGQGLLDAEWDHIELAADDYLAASEHATTFSGLEAYRVRAMALTGEGAAEKLSVGATTAGLFQLLGVQPVLGRVFAADEAFPTGAGAAVALLSHELWVRRFGADRGTIGRLIELAGARYEVVGILPPGFRLSSDAVATGEKGGGVDPGLRDVWIPLDPGSADCGNCLEVLGRIAPGRSAEEARAEVQRLLVDRPRDPPGQLARVVSHKERIVARFATPLHVLFGAAGLLLVIACLNVAGLLVGEATGRQHEIAVRSALGARGGRIVRQLLTESVLLGLIGAVAGAVVAWAGTAALLAVAPPLPRLAEVGVDARTLGFAVGTGVLTGIVFGLAPAFGLLGGPVLSSTRGSSRGRATSSLQAAVLVFQVALTVVLLAGGGLFGRSLARLTSVDPGFDPSSLATLAFDVPEAFAGSAEATARFQAEVVERARGVAGVTGVSATTELPFPGGKGARSFALEPDGEPVGMAMWHRSVLPDYHEIMGIPLLAGRLLSPSDDAGAPDVIVVSRSFAEQVWPGESPLGKRIYRTGPVGGWTVVGVVGDVRHRTLAAPPEPTLYRTLAQAPSSKLYLVARTATDPSATLTVIERSVHAVDPDVLVGEMGVMTSVVRASEADDRFRAILLGVFAVVATILASVGIFGVTARAVSARAREIGIRAALGARPGGLVGLLLRGGLATAVLGIAFGLVGAAWAGTLVRHLLYDVDPLDPTTFVGVALVALVVSLLATLLPAWRAATISPMDVISEE